MTLARFFVDAACAPGDEVGLHGDDRRHACVVLRVKAGDPIVIVAAHAVWQAQVVDADRAGVRARIVAPSDETAGELPVRVTVLQAIVKGPKFDEVVEKTVELGASTIIPIRCQRSHSDAGPNQLARWRRIARSAAAQSRRRGVPEIREPVSFTAAVSDAALQPCIVGYEGAPPGSLAASLNRIAATSSLSIAVGPEGSFTAAELQTARTAGCVFGWLGPTILRTETAAAAMLAAIACRRGWW
ncbi:MAG: 16S rRNA (uracil(1498)-N(3))-methyltransferase [Candidatus Eremiobacteraeota bacterium]|nr:16S rRNA (uracil(1498)-N(3))-methyltransferase [Candidatus Eremiobacteraeota bacterium]